MWIIWRFRAGVRARRYRRQPPGYMTPPFLPVVNVPGQIRPAKTCPACGTALASGVVDRALEQFRWVWCALAALLIIGSLAPFSCAPLAWIALVPAWWVLSRSESVRRRPFRYGYLLGLIYFAATFWWICDVTFLGIAFLIPYLALYPACWFLLVARFLKPWQARSNAALLFRALGAAALWVTLEWWRDWFLSGFDWNELGDSQATSIAFRQLAAFGGVHLISFVLVTVNVLWAEGLLATADQLRKRPTIQPSFPFGVALFIVAATFALGAHHLFRHRGETLGPPVRFACIQPDIPQIPGDENDQKMQKALDLQVALSIKAMADHPQILVWPEATIDEGVFNDQSMNDAVESVCERFGGYFLLGSQDFDIPHHKLYNAAYLFAPGGGKYDEYRKTHLVILGEYFPFKNPWLRRELGIGGMDFSTGPFPRKFTLAQPPVSFTPLICFEDSLQGVVDEAAPLKPDFFVTISDDAWYSGICGQWGIRQHLQEAVFRSVEHDRPMLRCSNNGISCVVDQNGTVVDRFRDGQGRDIDSAGIFEGTLHFYPAHRTLHEAWGDWIVLLSGAASVMLALPFFRARMRRGWAGRPERAS
jgi:apolipoprotein N-acyltransferase